MKNIIFIMLLGCLLASCGGGGSGGRSGENPPPVDTTPDAFVFAAQTDVAVGIMVESNAITVRGINSPATVSVSGGHYQVNGAEFTNNDGAVENGDVIIIRVMAAGELGTEVTAMLNIGGVTASFSVTTVMTPDTTPDAFTIDEKVNTLLNTWVESQTLALSGFNVPVEISIDGGEYAIAGGDFVSTSALLNPGQSVVVRHVSANEFTTATSSSLTVGGVTGVFRSTTAAKDVTPDQFTFVDQTNVAFNTLVESAAIQVTGINSPADISIVDGEYAINDGAYTSDPGMVELGQMVKVRHQSGDDFNIEKSSVLTIGGISDTFTSETEGPDTTPNTFSFDKQIDVQPGIVVTSEAITVTGINQPAAISISGGLYAIGNNALTDVPGLVNAGDTVYIQHTSSLSYSTNTTSVLTIGGVSAEFISLTWPIGTGFNQASGFDRGLWEVAQAADGSGDVYVAGNFDVFNSTASGGVIRLNSDGSMDENFVVGTGFTPSVFAVLPAQDGSGDVYIGGNFDRYNGHSNPAIVRLNEDGSFDPDFNANGFSILAIVNDIIFADDGSGDIYIAGDFDSYGDKSSPGLVRLNSDGSFDEGFNVGSGFNDETKKIVSANDGSGDIYVVTSASQYNGADISGLVRINSNGSLDESFNTGSGFSSAVTSIAMAGDGSSDIYVGGIFATYNGVDIKNFVRLNQNGSIDTVFQANRATIDIRVIDILSANNGTGDIYITGTNSTNVGYLIRVNSNGTIDSNFTAVEGVERSIRSLSLFENDKVFVVGDFAGYNGLSAKGLVLFQNDGEWDSRFRYATGFQGSTRKIIVSDDDSASIYVMGGFSRYRDFEVDGLVKLNSNGIEDPEFSLASLLYDGVSDVCLVGDGSGSLYVIASEKYPDPDVLLKVDSQGNLEDDFRVVLDTSYAFKVVLAKDGSGDIYIAAQESSISDLFILRYNSDGSIDESFSPPAGFEANRVNVIESSPDGSVYIGGDFTEYNGQPHGHIVKLRADGSEDVNFVGETGFNREVNEIVALDDESGKIYVGGQFSQFDGEIHRDLVRLNADGTLDEGFDPVVDSTVDAIALLNDNSGRLYVNDNRDIVRLFPDGSLDEAFDDGSGFSFVILDIQIAKDGSEDIFAAGVFTHYQNTTVDYIVRLNPDGTLN